MHPLKGEPAGHILIVYVHSRAGIQMHQHNHDSQSGLSYGYKEVISPSLKACMPHKSANDIYIVQCSEEGLVWLGLAEYYAEGTVM